MTSADPEEVVTAAGEGITVEKSFEPDDFPVPAIAFVVSSDRNEAVSIRLADDIPDDVEPENIGFHPKYGAEFWDVEDDSIVFEREIEAGEEYTTVYGLRGGGADLAAKFMSAPRLESVDPPLEEGDEDEPVDPPLEEDSENEPVTSPLEEGGENESVDPEDRPDPIDLDTGDSTEIDVEDSSDPETEGSAEPGDDPIADEAQVDTSEIEIDSSTEEPTAREGIDTEDGSEPPVQPTGDSQLLEALATEIRAADPDDPDLRTLRDALGLDPVRASVETRIEHLQSSVADLEAYTEALEEFLDENGDAQQLIEDVRSEYEETTARLDAVEELAEDATDSAESIEEHFEAELAELDAEIEALQADIDTLSADLSEVTEMRTRLANALGGLAEGPSDSGDDE